LYVTNPKAALVKFENQAESVKDYLRKNWDNLAMGLEAVEEEMAPIIRSWEKIQEKAGFQGKEKTEPFKTKSVISNNFLISNKFKFL
jgi:hypothetical protein